MSSKRFRNQLCAYCTERQSVTGDHIFAREFFLNDQRNDLPQAPVCERCNNEKSKAEHYLTTLLPFAARHARSAENLMQVSKRLQKNQRLWSELNQQGSEVTLFENGEGAKTIALPIREGVIESLFTYIVKGLAWHHWATYFGNSSSIEVWSLTTAGCDFFSRAFLFYACRATGLNRSW